MKYLVLLLICGSAWGDSINFGLLTHHNNNSGKNNNNNLIAIEYKNLIGAYFDNSYNQPTYLAGIKINIYRNIGFAAGLTYGYDLSPKRPKTNTLFKPLIEENKYDPQAF